MVDKFIKAITKPAEFLEEENGQFSSKRLFTFLVVVSTIVDWQHAVWTMTDGVWRPTIQTIGLVLGVLGFQVAGLFGEKKSDTPDQSKV
jgi:hypothetical protein